MLRLIFLMSLSVLFLNFSAIGQQSLPPEGGITNVDATSLINLTIEVRAVDKELVIPYCGVGETGNYLFCSGEARLEVWHGAKWSNAKPRTGIAGVFGLSPKNTWKSALIAAHSAGYFAFNFSKEFLDIQKGDRLRLRVNVWTSQESMANHDPDTTFVSPVFDCP